MLTSLVKFFLDPFTIIWLILLGMTAAWYFKKERLCRRLAIVAGLWFLIVSTPFIPVTIINSLEDRYDPLYTEELKDLEAEYHIIVLGGGHGFDDRLPANSLLSSNALGRLNEGIRLHRQLPNSKLVLSGYSSSGRTTQAEMLQSTAMLLGVDKESTILQKEPGNTYEEAMVYSQNYETKYPIILVTSATHMPRAVISFKNFGIEPIPSPTNYRLKGSWKKKWFGWPSMSNIENLRAGIYEYAAILKYSLI